LDRRRNGLAFGATDASILMTTSDVQIALSGVTKAYDGHVVLADANLAVRPGELVVVVGRSGSGKSTLLKLVGGLDRPTRGEVSVLGRRLDIISEREAAELRRRSMGFVFQFFNLIPTLTVGENVALPLNLNGLRREEASARTEHLLAELGLAGLSRRFPEEISGGEQQRVAIARAIAHEPQLVLADEPTGNLDLETASAVLALLDETCRRRGATLIMATHSREVVGMADRVLGIRNGRLEETAL
jgi:putative ABC transport system ATP-binding protein